MAQHHEVQKHYQCTGHNHAKSAADLRVPWRHPGRLDQASSSGHRGCTWTSLQVYENIFENQVNVSLGQTLDRQSSGSMYARRMRLQGGLSHLLPEATDLFADGLHVQSGIRHCLSFDDFSDSVHRPHNSLYYAAAALIAANLLAGELSRSLLYTRPPEWAEEEAGTEAAKPEAQRMRCIQPHLWTCIAYCCRVHAIQLQFSFDSAYLQHQAFLPAEVFCMAVYALRHDELRSSSRQPCYSIESNSTSPSAAAILVKQLSHAIEVVEGFASV